MTTCGRDFSMLRLGNHLISLISIRVIGAKKASPLWKYSLIMAIHSASCQPIHQPPESLKRWQREYQPVSLLLGTTIPASYVWWCIIVIKSASDDVKLSIAESIIRFPLFCDLLYLLQQHCNSLFRLMKQKQHGPSLSIPDHLSIIS